MLKPVLRFSVVLILSVFILSACNLPRSSANNPSSSDILITAAAQTVVAQLTQAASNAPATPTPLGVLPSSTQPPATQAPATEVPASSTSTLVPPSPTQLPTQMPATKTPVPTPCNWANFVTDVSYPDGSFVPAGSTFVKTWRLKNIGSCTWTSSYDLVFSDGTRMGGASSQKLTSSNVAPGETLDVSVTLKAPSTPGSYEGDWLLQDKSGNEFGIGQDAQSAFWVKIDSVEAARVSMKTGRTAVSVDGHVVKNGMTSYLIGALANQYMMVNINSSDRQVYLEIQAPDGTFLASADDKLESWEGTLPENGDYVLTIFTPGSASDFTYTVTIPVRIKFKSGAISASQDGTIGANDTNSYLLRALKGQTMTVTIDSDNSDVVLNIYGLQDGKTYVKASLGESTATFKLPSTQDYVIQCVSNGSSTENYTITFKVQ